MPSVVTPHWVKSLQYFEKSMVNTKNKLVFTLISAIEISEIKLR
jgi:hypothetical protein